MTKDEFLSRTLLIHGDQYEYPDLPPTVTTNMRIVVKCKHHGNFIPTVNKHIYAKTGCRLCYNGKVAKRLTKTTDWFVDKATQKHNNKYSYEQTNYIGTKQSVKITCLTHGTFIQTPNDHLSGYGCPECAQDIRRRTTVDTLQFIERAIQVHGELYDYSKTTYDRCKKKVTIVCKKHGIFQQTPNSHLNGCGCSKCKISKGEMVVLRYLNQHNIPYEFQKYQRCDNTNLWFDFVIDKTIVIEVDGIQHREQNSYFHKTVSDFTSQQHRDKLKEQFCQLHNLQLHRVEYNGKHTQDVVNTVHQILQEQPQWHSSAKNITITSN